MGARKHKPHARQTPPKTAVPPTLPPAQPMASRVQLWPYWIALAAVAVRILYFIQFVRSPLLLSLGPDDLYYLDWAKRTAGGDWLGDHVFEQGPLYPYLLGALFSVLGEMSGLVYLLQMFCGVFEQLIERN